MALLPAVWTLQPSDSDAADVAPADPGLVERASRGDEEAFRALFDLHAPAVHRFLAELLGSVVQADEGTQETFVRAYDRLAGLRAMERVRPWLLGIARNVSLELRRSMRRLALA